MSTYYWDEKIAYLKRTRWLYYNDDYLEFLVQKVWAIDDPVNIIDYGCGYGYLGLKLLPLLPEGSTYTGVDLGEELIREARELFQHLPYTATFIQGDIETIELEKRYDVAMCHAFLLHMTNVQAVLRRMIHSVRDQGRIVCFEPHWIGNMANVILDGREQSDIVKLGNLQKLYEQDHAATRKDGNIGLKLPLLLSQLGVTEVQCRVSDRVNVLDQQMDEENKADLFEALQQEGIGARPSNREEMVERLIHRGLTLEEAVAQYEAERTLSLQFSIERYLAYAPNMKITFGRISR